MGTGTLIVLGIVAVLVVAVIGIYNSLVTSRNRVEEAWADIDTQLQRRHNLIPNLIETVKGYAKHESGVLKEVTEARSKAINAGTVEEQGKAENMLQETLKSLFAVAESYPDLKANQNFAKLQDELTDTENKVQASRRFYNGNVRDYNIKIEVFPNNVLVGVFGFKQKDLFDIDDENVRKSPKVNFDTKK